MIDLFPDCLGKLLHLRPGVAIVGADWDFQTECVQLYLSGPDLPLQHEGEPVRRVQFVDVMDLPA